MERLTTLNKVLIKMDLLTWTEPEILRVQKIDGIIHS